MWLNRKGQRAGKREVEPLYTIADAMQVKEYLHTCEYGEEVALCDGVKAVFTDAGHLLGSASITLELTEGDITKTIVFSGDIGNTSFAVGRTQELLYFIREIKEKGMVYSVPNFPVYIDSPLAREATEVFSGDLRGYLDEEAIALVQGGVNMFTFPGLMMTSTSEESKALNMDLTPKVIISASGMCDAGRIRHHLKHNLWRSECTICFVGYQAQGSLGARLLDGVDKVRLFGEEIAVHARIVKFEGMSSHADLSSLLEWVGAFAPRPEHVFVVHGDADVAPVFAQNLKDRGYSVHAPEYTEVYDLAANRVLSPGYTPERKKTVPMDKGSAAYQRLESVGLLLQEVIRHNKGGTNKDLGKFADQIRALIEKWDR